MNLSGLKVPVYYSEVFCVEVYRHFTFLCIMVIIWVKENKNKKYYLDLFTCISQPGAV